MKLAALAKLIKADAYCKLYNVCYEAGGYDLYIGTRTGIYSLAGFPKAQNSDELASAASFIFFLSFLPRSKP